MSAKEKVAIVTGCNSGIGKETVRGLAKEGVKIYMACRDMKKCEQAREDIMKDIKTASIHCRQCDLADFDSIRKFAHTFQEEEERLDILINNAGVFMWGPKKLTKQGIEMQLGVNHVGHFLLTNLLLDLLQKSAPSRIIVVASAAYGKTEKINFTDINFEKSHYSALKAYEQSKLANILFAKELARRLVGSRVTVNSLHPGIVKTEIGRTAGWLNNPVSKLLLKSFLKTPAQGATTSLYLAMDSSLADVTGNYFIDCRPTPLSRQGEDMTAAAKLWTMTEEIIKIKSEIHLNPLSTSEGTEQPMEEPKNQ